MTRPQFYVTTIAMCVIATVRIILADNKEQITSQIHWLIATVLAYMIWCDWDWIPRSWWRKNEAES